ncbi:MAG: DUF6607 family protein [Pseudomonadota bacterium]
MLFFRSSRGRLAAVSGAFLLATSALLTSAAITADIAAEPEAAVSQTRQYTFAWQFIGDSAMAPRGGTTKGTGVELVTTPTDAWRALREPELEKRERDRRAILAMAGPHRTSFDFIETVGFTEGYSPEAPYQSWGTEYVYVVADEPEFVSLQHILVMRMTMPDGTESEPIVVKHWRQDWRYEHRDLHVYAGKQTWTRSRLDRRDVRGQWTQTVYQVDDSPRYQASGNWQHFANYSAWESNETWRPLPRREFSVRDDYDVLIGTNRHTITPTGWVQEEDNLKVALDEDGGRLAVLAREAGIARYERIDNFDWSAGDDYWAKTGPFWEVVRDVWAETLAANDVVGFDKSVDGKPMFAAMFELSRSTTADGFDETSARSQVEEALARYLR